mmetsp:Transcript_55759/g.135102  ORF Transcript_55759/g.135102 Transcript_55759/m.135102 type:complete len:404 (-) Transcript_55759:9-1220(-)
MSCPRRRVSSPGLMMYMALFFVLVLVSVDGFVSHHLCFAPRILVHSGRPRTSLTTATTCTGSFDDDPTPVAVEIAALSSPENAAVINEEEAVLADAEEKTAQLSESITTTASFKGLGVARHAIPMSIAIIIGSFSVMEILESLREMSERQLGHAHGVTVLAFIRLFRSMTFLKLLRTKRTALKVARAKHKALTTTIKAVRAKKNALKAIRAKKAAVKKMMKGAAVLQTQTEELEERAELLGHVVVGAELVEDHHDETKKRSIQSTITEFITSPGVAISAAILAVVACVVEIIDDMKPGAHHGAALLALSELYYQARRLKARVKKDRNRTSAWRASWMGQLWEKLPVGPLIAIAAAVYAGIEIVEDLQPGSHHGVAILALAELVENINRSRVLHQLPQVSAGTS